jgi:hypothetical protein
MRHKFSALLLPVLIGLPSSGYAQLSSGVIAPARAIDWSTAGVEGGIPSATWTQCGATIAPYSGSATTINNAISSCGSNQYVKLGAGTLALSSGIHLSKSNVVLRGSGANQTFLVINGIATMNCNESTENAISICTGNNGQAGSANWTGSGGQTGSYTKGSTTITLSSVTGITVGQPIFLDQANDSSDWPSAGDLYVCDVGSSNCSSQGGGGAFARSGRSNVQISKVTAVSGNQVTISPGILLPNYRASQSPGAYWFNSNVFIQRSGIEDLSVDFLSMGGTDIKAVYAYNCWVAGVRSLYNSSAGTFIFHVNFIDSYRNTVRDSYFFGPTAGPGAQTQYPATVHNSGSLLWENNIFQHIQGALVTNGPNTGSVFSYNFFPGRQGPGVVLHNAGEMMNIVEGNLFTGFYGDVVHGTHFMDTVFRNAMIGQRYSAGTGTIPAAIHLQSKNRFMNIVGNVMGDSYFTTYETTSSDSRSSIYVLGWQGDASGVAMSSDANVKRTLLRWGNWDSVTSTNESSGNDSTGTRFVVSEVPSSIPNFPNPVPSTQALPASLYLAAKPTWWPSTKPWPLIGPDVANGNVSGLGGHAYTNPAADCYLNVMRGATDGSGSPLAFSRASCYGNTATPPPPAPSAPSNLKIIR